MGEGHLQGEKTEELMTEMLVRVGNQVWPKIDSSDEVVRGLSSAGVSTCWSIHWLCFDGGQTAQHAVLEYQRNLKIAPAEKSEQTSGVERPELVAHREGVWTREHSKWLGN